MDNTQQLFISIEGEDITNIDLGELEHNPFSEGDVIKLNFKTWHERVKGLFRVIEVYHNVGGNYEKHEFGIETFITVKRI